MNTNFISQRSFSIDLLSPRLVTFPNLLDHQDKTGVPFVSATVQIKVDDFVVCEWDDDNVFAALDDLAYKTSFNAGPDLHLDVYYSDEDVNLGIHANGATDLAATIKTKEAAYDDALACARFALEDWCTANLNDVISAAVRP